MNLHRRGKVSHVLTRTRAPLGSLFAAATLRRFDSTLGGLMSIVSTAAVQSVRLPAQIEISECAVPNLLPGATPNVEYRSYRVGGLAPWQAKRVQLYIQNHLNARIRATELANLVNLSVSHFSRAFRETFRLPPAAYIAHSRMKRAQQLMLGSAEPLAEIALECGMADQSHFTRTFRRVSGMSPGLWRRIHSDGPQ